MLKVSGTDLEGLKAEYLQHLQLKNYSPLTLRQMDQNLRIFMGYLKGRGIVDIGKVDRETFEHYKAYLSQEYVSRKGKPLTSGTIISRMFNIQNWFVWMKKKGVIFFNPCADVKLPKTERRLPRGIMRPDEVRRVMDQPDLKTPLGYRDRTMMEVLYSTGMRAAELVKLQASDVDLQKKVVRIRNGKGGKDRFVPLSTPCCRFLERYINVTRPELAEGMRPSGNNWLKKAGTGGDRLFLSLYGGPVSSNWLAGIMKRYMLKAGINHIASPVHSWRHSVATHLLESGMDVRYVQVLLGHENITSTQIYTHVERKTLQRLMKAHHPREMTGETVQPFVEEEKREYAVA